MTAEAKTKDIRDILDTYLAPQLVDDIMNDLTKLAEEKLENTRFESLVTVANEKQSMGCRMAWYSSHMGEMDMCKMLGLITEDRRQKLYREWTSHRPE